MRDLRAWLTVKQDLANAVSKTTNAGTTGIDTMAFNGGNNGLVCVFSMGAITDGTFTPQLQHATQANYSDAVNVPANMQVGAFAVASTGVHANEDQAVGYIGQQRYVRFAYVVGGAPATGGEVGTHFILGYPANLPAA